MYTSHAADINLPRPSVFPPSHRNLFLPCHFTISSVKFPTGNPPCLSSSQFVRDNQRSDRVEFIGLVREGVSRAVLNDSLSRSSFKYADPRVSGFLQSVLLAAGSTGFNQRKLGHPLLTRPCPNSPSFHLIELVVHHFGGQENGQGLWTSPSRYGSGSSRIFLISVFRK